MKVRGGHDNHKGHMIIIKRIKRGRLSLTAMLLYDSEVEELTRLLEILYYAVLVH